MDKSTKRILIVACAALVLSAAAITVLAVTSINRSRAEAAEAQRVARIRAEAELVEAEAMKDRLHQADIANQQSRQVSGRGDDRRAAIDSFETKGVKRQGSLEGLLVTGVTVGGALAGYGLQKDDEIVRVNGMKIGDLSADDPETAKVQVVQNGFQAMAPIVVVRGGKQITLPDKGVEATNSVDNQLKELGIKTR